MKAAKVTVWDLSAGGKKLHEHNVSSDVAAGFCAFATVATNAKQLSAAVEAQPAVAELTDEDGRRAIDVAHKECRKAMMAALYLLGRYDVDATAPLHFSATSAVLAATDHANPDAKQPLPRRALKAMRQPEQVLAELTGRKGLRSDFVAGVLAVYVDELSIAPCLTRWRRRPRSWQALRSSGGKLASRLESKLEERTQQGRDGGGGNGAPADRPQQQAGVAKQVPLGRTEGYSLLVLDLADRSLSTTLVHDHIAGHDFFLIRKIASDVAHCLDHLHEQGRIHADLKPLNAVRVGSRWQLIDMDVSCAIGEPFGAKVPSSGYCPPEMAKVLLNATELSTGKIDPQSWCVQGERRLRPVVVWRGALPPRLRPPLWLTDQNDNVTHDDLLTLAGSPKLQQVLMHELCTLASAATQA